MLDMSRSRLVVMAVVWFGTVSSSWLWSVRVGSSAVWFGGVWFRVVWSGGLGSEV